MQGEISAAGHARGAGGKGCQTSQNSRLAELRSGTAACHLG